MNYPQVDPYRSLLLAVKPSSGVSTAPVLLQLCHCWQNHLHPWLSATFDVEPHTSPLDVGGGSVMGGLGGGSVMGGGSMMGTRNELLRSVAVERVKRYSKSPVLRPHAVQRLQDVFDAPTISQ